MIWFMRKHWLLLTILTLQLVNIGLLVERKMSIQLNEKTFQTMVVATMEYSYAAGRQSCQKF